MRLALVEEYRLADGGGQFELPGEGLALHRPGREVPEIIEAAFADGHDFLMGGQCGEPRCRLRVILERVVRVHACGGEQLPRGAAREGQRLGAAPGAGARDDQARHPGGGGPGQHRATVMVEGIVREVGADVDQAGHAAGAASTICRSTYCRMPPWT